ncbi:hypothetical protein [Marimonas lutisalis]|uniref:hypothetical protein n=1 Tax=Marimonas lutisalis TaxID=2545756 RepID=UPI0010F6E6F6|nr:hypothetical protein [Marimonas lutisalis]
MNTSSIVFCVGSIVVSLAVAWVAFPYAALDSETISAAQVPQPAEMMPDVEVGNGFGELPVMELMGYYVENPPAPVAAGAAPAPEIKFGGC